MNWMRTIAKWSVPWAAYELAGKAKKRIEERRNLSIEDRGLLAVNSELRDRHKGERCFVLATGPSIKKQDLRPLKNELCISVSNFFVHQHYDVIKPRYHCIAPYHLPISEDEFQAWLKDIAQITRAATIFFSLGDRGRVCRNNYFDGHDVRFLGCCTDESATINSSIELTENVMNPQSVTIMALQAAIYMGFKEIYLLGVDHDHILHIGEMKHFYEETEHVVQTDEWFLPNLGNEFANNWHLWEQYIDMKRCADKRHIGIYNATEGGLLDVYPRVSLNDILL